MVVGEAKQLLSTQIAYADLDIAVEDLKKSSQWPAKLPDVIKRAKELQLSGEYQIDLSKLNDYLKPDGSFKDKYSYANDWTVLSARNENYEGGTGMYACILDTGDANILACRGSEDMTNMLHFKQDWYEGDMQLLNSEMTKQEDALLDYMTKNADMLNDKPWVATGHSLGGALADFAAITAVNLGLDNFSGATNFDGPGHSQEFIDKYRTQIAQAASRMVHIRASIVGSILFTLPGVSQVFIKTYDVKPLAKHSPKNWERNDDDTLKEGEQGIVEFLVEKITRALDRLPSCIGNQLPHIVFYAVFYTHQFGEFADDHPALISAMTTAVVIFLLLNPAVVAMAVEVVAALVVVVFVLLSVLVVGEIIIEVLEMVVEAIVNAICVAVSWLSDRVAELFNAIKDFIGSVNEFFRSISAGGRYADSNPCLKVDTDKLSSYAGRISNVNRRLDYLDSALRSCFWQVPIYEMWRFAWLNFLTSGSPTLRQIETYLYNAADCFVIADDNARDFVTGG